MRRDELIIDGTSVDLADAQIALTYTNNILSDIDKISASHSYTITLPLSVRNERLFDYPTSVSHESSKVGKYLDAEYRRNGITIVRDAKAYVTQVSESGIEVCLLWDGLARLSKWLKEEHSLNELQLPEITWSGTPTDYFDRANDPVVEVSYNTGVSGAPIPPAVSLETLLSYIIAESLGMEYKTSDVRGMDKELRELFVPLCSRGGTRSPNQGGTYGNPWVGYLVSGTLAYIYPRQSGKLVFENSYADVSEFSRVILSINVTAKQEQVYNATAGVKVVVYTVASDDTSTLQATINGTLENGVYTMVGMVDIDTTSVAKVRVLIQGLNVYGSNQGQTLRGGFTLVPYTKTANLRDPYDAGINLPDIKQVDFLKTICTMFGCQVVNQNGKLVFVSVDTLYNNKAKALDWTDKVINYKRIPKSAKFGVGSFAQTNWLRYKEDDAVETDADGAFYVENETLDKEKDVATIVFAPTDGKTIVHYEQEEGKTEVKDVKVEPRIMRAYNKDGKLGLEFTQSLYMSSIIMRWYNGLRQLLKYPVQIVVYARLNERDLANIDWTIPVYLKQTGQYYIVKEIKTDSDGEISETTLIQL